MTTHRPLYLIAGEYSADVGDPRPTKVFRRAPRPGEEAPPPLDDLLRSACQRALDSTLIEGIEDQVTHLLVTTMVYGEGMDHELMVNRPNRLKYALALPDRCRAGFEMASSDAGASVFASAVRLLRGLDEPATALVTAGQTLRGGREALRTVALVLEEVERAQGLNMPAVGDLLMDVFVQRWRRDGAGKLPGTWRDQAHAMIDAWVQQKLVLSREYAAAQRSGDDPGEVVGSDWITPWFRVAHMAPASVGAAATIMTTDEALAAEWSLEHPTARVVQVSGVATGDTHLLITRREEPLGYFAAVRRAFDSLCRSTGTGPEYLRAAAFGVFHDAFASIELAFLQSLGFSPNEAMQRALTYWPNPYGGLTSFGHALGASGLVQVVKAFHVFTQPQAYLPAPAEEGSHHVDFATTAKPIHCVTTSVGGPLTNVVATILRADEPGTLGPATEALPRRHRPDGPGFHATTMPWLRAEMRRYREALGEERGVLEARTKLDLRGTPLPLPEAFVDRWRPGALRLGSGDEPLPPELGREAAELAAAGDGGALKSWVISRAKALSMPRPGLAEATGRRALWDALRLPAGSLLLGGSGAAVRGLCLLAAPADDLEAVPSGSVLRVIRTDDAMTTAEVIEEPTTHLAPPWLLWPEAAGPPRSLLGDDQVGQLVARLRREDLNVALLEEVHEVASRVSADLRRLELAPPLAAIRLFRELVWAAVPDRYELAEALATLLPAQARVDSTPEPAMGYVEFDVVRARDKSSAELVRALRVLRHAARRAEAWLAGAHLTYNRLRDGMAVTLTDPRLTSQPAAMRVLLLRFARDVYQYCRDRGEAIRGAACIDVGTPIEQVEGRLGGAGRVQMAAQIALEQTGFGRRTLPEDGAPKRVGHGIALVIPSADVAEARATCDAAWRDVAGEVLVPAAEERFVVGGQDFFTQLRRRAEAP